MRPIKLQLCNFGPYVDQTIDFSEFFDTPVFLISGKTGTGKTTIFDAMCFALFGQTSGGEREAEEMRSDFATDQDITEVTFVFEDQQKLYQITRSPKQTVASKRGGGQTTRTAKVSLLYEDAAGEKREIDKINQANQFISDLLNLTAEQFAQIVLLPQGQFRNFLAADSNAKETVLRELFGTKFYQNFVENIKERAKQRRTATNELLNQLQNVQGNANFAVADQSDPEQPVLDWLEVLQAEIKRQEEELAEYEKTARKNEQLKTRLDRLYQSQQSLLEDQQKLADYQKEAQVLKEEQPNYDQLATQIADLEWVESKQGLLKDLTDAVALQKKLVATQAAEKKRYEELVQELKDNTIKKEQLANREPQIAAFQGQFERLKDKVDLYQAVEQLQKQQQEKHQTVTTLKQKLLDCQQQLATNAENERRLTEEAQQYVDLPEQAAILQERKNQIANLKQQLESFQQKTSQHVTVAAEIADLQVKLTAKQATAKQTLADYEDLENQFVQNQIITLAAQLKPETACPLCGSTEHPHPAVSGAVTVTVTKEAVKELQQRAQQAAAVVNTSQGDLTARKNYYAQQEIEVAEQKNSLTQVLGLTEAATESQVSQAVQQSSQQYEADRQVHERRVTASQELEKQVAQLKKAAVELTTTQQTMANDHHQEELAEQKLVTMIEQQQDQLPAEYTSSQELKQQLADWQTQISAYQDERQAVQKQEGLLQSSLAGVKAGIDGRTEQLEETASKQASAQEELDQALASAKKTFDLKQLKELSKETPVLGDYRQKLENYRRQLTVNKTAQDQLVERIAGQPAPQIAETTQRIKKLQGKQDELFAQRSRADHLYHENQETAAKVTQLWDHYQQTLSEDQQWNQLADVVSGKGKLKLNLERYVLQSYFQQVIEVANQRFAELTDGRYSFCLDDQAGSYAANTGLELNIYDDNAGKVRSVHTLSGGESFIAALCLALALGEVVSAQAGGISVEALFVDEGFGSLDTESLQVALDALRAIEGKNRLIGIISHVTELRTEIPDQLHVISEHGRSRISYDHEFEH